MQLMFNIAPVVRQNEQLSPHRNLTNKMTVIKISLLSTGTSVTVNILI